MIALGEAGADTQDAALRRARQLLMERHFTVDDDGNLHARMREVLVMGQPVMVPTVVLERPRPLAVDQFEIEFETDISLPEGETEESSGADIRVGLQKRMFRKSSHARVRAVFKSEEPTEGMQLLNDKMSRIFRDHLATVITEAALGGQTDG